MTPIFALTTHSIDQAIFHVANALQVPVLILPCSRWRSSSMSSGAI